MHIKQWPCITWTSCIPAWARSNDINCQPNVKGKKCKILLRMSPRESNRVQTRPFQTLRWRRWPLHRYISDLWVTVASYYHVMFVETKTRRKRHEIGFRKHQENAKIFNCWIKVSVRRSFHDIQHVGLFNEESINTLNDVKASSLAPTSILPWM